MLGQQWNGCDVGWQLAADPSVTKECDLTVEESAIPIVASNPLARWRWVQARGNHPERRWTCSSSQPHPNILPNSSSTLTELPLLRSFLLLLSC